MFGESYQLSLVTVKIGGCWEVVANSSVAVLKNKLVTTKKHRKTKENKI
jgi:hypothetical protein